tara:strand:- start:45 stop:305 length:261 start_codon:yes stop_codon:yes gene_type:complete
MKSECPPEFYECYTEEQFNDIIDLFEENDMVMPESLGDVEAAGDFVWQILFLTPVELIYVGISMSVLATYGLSIYYMYKKIQKKFS